MTIRAAFAACGVRAGDVVMLHSDALITAQFDPMTAEARYDLLIDSLLDLLGPQGTLIVPTFTYSLSHGDIYDPEKSPSAVGAISEHFRRRRGVRRSRNPMYSVAVLGHLSEELLKADDSDCFGKNSIFGTLHERNALIICAGCALDRVTFVHFVEQDTGVDYRYFKLFQGSAIGDGGVQRAVATRCYVRDLNRRAITDLERLRSFLMDRGGLLVGALGRVEMIAVRARDFYDGATALLQSDPCALIQEGAAA